MKKLLILFLGFSCLYSLCYAENTSERVDIFDEMMQQMLIKATRAMEKSIRAMEKSISDLRCTSTCSCHINQDLCKNIIVKFKLPTDAQCAFSKLNFLNGDTLEAKVKDEKYAISLAILLYTSNLTTITPAYYFLKSTIATSSTSYCEGNSSEESVCESISSIPIIGTPHLDKSNAEYDTTTHTLTVTIPTECTSNNESFIPVTVKQQQERKDIA